MSLSLSLKWPSIALNGSGWLHRALSGLTRPFLNKPKRQNRTKTKQTKRQTQYFQIIDLFGLFCPFRKTYWSVDRFQKNVFSRLRTWDAVGGPHSEPARPTKSWAQHPSELNSEQTLCQELRNEPMESLVAPQCLGRP